MTRGRKRKRVYSESQKIKRANRARTQRQQWEAANRNYRDPDWEAIIVNFDRTLKLRTPAVPPAHTRDTIVDYPAFRYPGPVISIPQPVHPCKPAVNKRSKKTHSMKKSKTKVGRDEERKFADVAPNSYSADTTGAVILLNGVATGTDFTNRIGRKIMMRTVKIEGFLTKETAVQNACYCRILIVYDLQPNGAAPVQTDLFLTASSTDQFNMNNRDRFRVLVDKKFVLGSTNNTATQAVAEHPGTHVVSFTRRLNLETIYGGTGATIASIVSGALWMFAIGNAANCGLLTNSSRVTFTDA